MRSSRGRFVSNADGEVVQVGPVALPDALGALPAVDQAPVMGPTRVGEWLMVDVRVAKAVEPGTRIFKICQDVAEREHCGVIGATLVVDLLEVRSEEDRHFLLNRANWPRP